MSEAEDRLQRIADLCENCNSLDEAQQIARGGKHETVDGCDQCWVEDVESQLTTAKLRYEKAEAALGKITPGQLMALAAWLDKTDAQIGHAGDEVQIDLREWARLLEDLNLNPQNK